MFYVKSGENVLHHPYSDYLAEQTKLSEETNTHGSLDITLSDLRNTQVRDGIEVYDDDGLRWRGRVLTIDTTLDGKNDIHCEGWLAVLCDTVLPPFAYRGTPADLFRAIINNHNSQLSPSDPRRLTIGSVTITDPNNYINRSSESAMTSWEAIESRLIELSGGYIYLSGQNLNVINYVDDFTVHSGQTVRFAENLIDLKTTADANGVVTAMIPYGAQFPETIDSGGEQVPNPDYEKLPEPGEQATLPFFEIWGGNRLKLDDPVVWQTAVDKYGYVYGTAQWDDVTVAANLQTAALKWIQQNFLEHIGALEVTAADLSLIDASVDKIGVGNYVDVICEPLNIELTLLCMRKETDLVDVSKTSISLGKTPATLTAVIK